jgi:hypothetical protein
MKLLFDYKDLPEKIIENLPTDIMAEFVAAIKTSYRPNAAIPTLWLVIHKGGLFFCTTHKTRGIYKNFLYREIDSIKIGKGAQLFNPSVEIIMSDINKENFIFSMDKYTNFEKLIHVFETNNYQVLKN